MTTKWSKFMVAAAFLAAALAAAMPAFGLGRAASIPAVAQECSTTASGPCLARGV